MSHRGHRYWGRFPYSKMITVSCTCQWKKCTRIAVLFYDRPGQPSTGLFRIPPGGQKCDTVCTRFLTRGRGFPIQSTLRFTSMLCLYVPQQKPDIHLLPALLALNLTPMPLPVQRPLSHHPSSVRRLWLCPLRLTRASDHSDCLTDVSIHAEPVNQADQGANISLDTLRVRRCDT